MIILFPDGGAATARVGVLDRAGDLALAGDLAFTGVLTLDAAMGEYEGAGAGAGEDFTVFFSFELVIVSSVATFGIKRFPGKNGIH